MYYINHIISVGCFTLYIIQYSLQLIGRSVGQLFRKEVKIDNLPRIEVFGKQQAVRVDEVSENSTDSGFAALFAGPT